MVITQQPSKSAISTSWAHNTYDYKLEEILNSITFSLFLLQFVSLNSLAWPCFDT